MFDESPERIIDIVLRRFVQVDNQQTKWTSLDTNMSMLEWLDDNQTVKEAEIVHSEHSMGKVRCKMNHIESKCFAPMIVTAVGHIVSMNKESGHLTSDQRYVLQYYISLAKIGEIFPVSEA